MYQQHYHSASQRCPSSALACYRLNGGANPLCWRYCVDLGGLASYLLARARHAQRPCQQAGRAGFVANTSILVALLTWLRWPHLAIIITDSPLSRRLLMFMIVSRLFVFNDGRVGGLIKKMLLSLHVRPVPVFPVHHQPHQLHPKPLAGCWHWSMSDRFVEAWRLLPGYGISRQCPMQRCASTSMTTACYCARLATANMRLRLYAAWRLATWILLLD